MYEEERKTPTEDGWTVYLKDKCCQYHFLADTFSAYWRLYLVHLGIRNWQYAFTPYGLDPGAREMMARYAPERLVVDLAG